MKARSAIIHLLIVLLIAPSVMAQPRQEPSDVWRAFAEKLDPGAFVSVRLKDGKRVEGHLIQVTADALRVQPKTRIPVPIRDLAFADVDSIEPQKEGMSPGAKVLLGAGIGAGIIMWLVVRAIQGS